MADINLSPYSAESDAIARKLRMAEMLNQQAMQPLEIPQQMGVPISHFAGLAKMLQSYKGAQKEKEAKDEAKALAEKYREQSQNEVASFLDAIQGKKEIAGQFIPQQNFTPSGADLVQGPEAAPLPRNDMGEVIQQTYYKQAEPAVAPDMQKALAVALGAQANPTIQAAGGALLSSMMKPAESAFAKLNPKDYTADSVKVFMATGGKDYSLLKPLEKLTTTDTNGVIQARNPYTFEPVGPAISKEIDPATVARLKQERELSDRAFGQLSANQRAQLANDAARIGISAQELFYNTGIQAGGGAMGGGVAPPMAQQPNAPTSAPSAMGAPAAPQRPSYTPLGQMPMGGTNLPLKMQNQMALENLQADAKKARGMQGIGTVIDQARNVLTGKTVNEKGEVVQAPLPTQSYLGAAGDVLASVAARSPQGAAQADQLKVLGGALVMSMPRMEGPQSNADMILYREMAGQIGDNTLPVARRLTALGEVERLYRKYDLSSPTAPEPTQPTQPMTGQPPPGAVRRIR